MAAVRLLAAPLILMLCACSGTRGHELQPGDFAFTETQVLSDACGLLPAEGLWDGTLTGAGDYVSVAYGLAGISLAGHYRYSVEEFYADGTAQEVSLATARGACRVDQVQIHLDAIVRGPTRFEGSMAIRTFARAQPACECLLSVTYRADRQ